MEHGGGGGGDNKPAHECHIDGQIQRSAQGGY
jgi:hypothetical protein